MKSILHQLYYGEISPATQYEARLEEYHQMQEQHGQEYESLAQSLEPIQRKKLAKLMDQQFDAIPMEYADTFVDGFRLGVKMMLAVFQEELTVSRSYPCEGDGRGKPKRN